MQSKMIFVLLFILSFSAFHDSFISLLDKNKQTNIVHYMSDDVSSIECTDINEIHNMFHFIAIVSMYNNNHIQLLKALPMTLTVNNSKN